MHENNRIYINCFQKVKCMQLLYFTYYYGHPVGDIKRVLMNMYIVEDIQ